MDRQTQDQIAKFICIAVGCVIAFYVLMWMLPYIEFSWRSVVPGISGRNTSGTIDATGTDTTKTSR